MEERVQELSEAVGYIRAREADSPTELKEHDSRKIK
jgi:hypothetical protein